MAGDGQVAILGGTERNRTIGATFYGRDFFFKFFLFGNERIIRPIAVRLFGNL